MQLHLQFHVLATRRLGHQELHFHRERLVAFDVAHTLLFWEGHNVTYARNVALRQSCPGGCRINPSHWVPPSRDTRSCGWEGHVYCTVRHNVYT